MREAQTDLLNNISLQLWLVKLLQDGRIDEEQFIKLHGEYENQIEQLMSQRREMMEDAQILDLKKASNEVKVYYDELKKKRELGIISEEEYIVKAKSFDWEINNFEKEISTQEARIEFLKNLPSGMSFEEIMQAKTRVENYRKKMESLNVSRDIKQDTIAVVKQSLDKILKYFEEFDELNHKPEVRIPEVRLIQEEQLDRYVPEITRIKMKKPELHELRVEEKIDEIQDIIIEVKEEDVEKPKIIRVMCPYVDVKGDKCKVMAFGKTEDDAYKKLESHIKKHHPEKLTDIKETYARA